MRTSSANVVPVIHHEFEPAPSAFDSAQFKLYRKKVEKLMSKDGITIGAIHRTLADEAIPKWTLDVLETSDVCECVPGALLDRWRRRAKQNFIHTVIAPMGIVPLGDERD